MRALPLRRESENVQEKCGLVETTKKENEVGMAGCKQYPRNQNLKINGLPQAERENLK